LEKASPGEISEGKTLIFHQDARAIPTIQQISKSIGGRLGPGKPDLIADMRETGKLIVVAFLIY
jgi:hypothetical protein